ncbi:unnamed protein product [Adineta steineri]|uniref:G-protein coupled receptors family 1 profile domain-containing protein n=2 Tax=Adineta steineri TaxID=433720 RepID=A0A819ZF92_9BILA|nr:unnamed protein product [Adineta steineri]
MSSMDWDATLVSILNNTSSQLNRYFSIIIFAFGTIGNILNILVLAEKTFRSNSCALLFLVSSMANLVTILSGLIPRMLSGWITDLTNTISWLCKSRLFLLWTVRTIALWIIVLAAIDRWLLTSTHIHRRQFSTLRNAYHGIIMAFIFSIILNVELFYCYEANVINAPSKCYGRTDTCRLITDFSYAFLTNIIPIFFMLVFGIKTILNVRHTRKRLRPENTSTTPIVNQPNRTKKIDRYMLVSLLTQVIILSIFLLPSAILKVYSTLTIHYNKSPLQNAIENFIFNIGVLFSYIGSGSTFYIFTLCGGKLYRDAVRNLMKLILMRIRCKISERTLNQT